MVFEAVYWELNIFNHALCTDLCLDQDPQAELVAQLAQEYYNHNIFLLLVNSLSKFDFEVSLMQ